LSESVKHEFNEKLETLRADLAQRRSQSLLSNPGPFQHSQAASLR
jgi:hypothetical protein